MTAEASMHSVQYNNQDDKMSTVQANWIQVKTIYYREPVHHRIPAKHFYQARSKATLRGPLKLLQVPGFLQEWCIVAFPSMAPPDLSAYAGSEFFQAK
ncbi:hypothetical protein BaRGS_00034261 [Batillaria attramentaria]|uniref:Uncharacterized protein n=1 Tax=Batillaria attramentaria TaxID=370345 RepID=A0ABD0JHV1_9CAEN